MMATGGGSCIGNSFVVPGIVMMTETRIGDSGEAKKID